MKCRLVNKTGFALVMLGLFAISACTLSNPTPTPQPEEAADIKPVVSATGMIVPLRWSTLSLPASGVVDDILVQENDTVNPGQILVRLRGTDSQQAAITAARLELASAQYTYDQLNKDLQLKAAEASKVVVEARKAIRDAERRIANLNTPTASRDIEQTRANLAILKDRLEQAYKDYRPYEKKPEDNLKRAGLLSKVAQLEKEYEALERKLNNQLGTANELDLQEAESNLELANAQLETALRELEIKQAGPDPEEVVLAKARLDNAKAQLSAAQAALKDLELLAPFAGTVSELNIKAGQWVASGQPVLQLADLEKLQVETTDLNEIDAARIQVGDSALVTFDALPEVSVQGKLTRIAPKSASGAGVNYTVNVALDELPADLRWGMTAFVDIEVAE